MKHTDQSSVETSRFHHGPLPAPFPQRRREGINCRGPPITDQNFESVRICSERFGSPERLAGFVLNDGLYAAQLCQIDTGALRSVAIGQEVVVSSHNVLFG